MIVLLILLNVRFIATPRFTPWNNCSGGGCNCNREMWRQHRRLWSWIVRWLNSVGLGVFFDSTEGDFIHWAVLKHMKLNVSDNLSAKMQLVCRLLQRVGQPGSGCSSLSTLFSTYPSPSLDTFLGFFLGGSPLIFSIFSMKNGIFKHKIWCQAMKLSNVRISCLNSNGQAAGPKAERPNELRIESDPMIFVKIGQSSNRRTSTY